MTCSATSSSVGPRGRCDVGFYEGGYYSRCLQVFDSICPSGHVDPGDENSELALLQRRHRLPLPSGRLQIRHRRLRGVSEAGSVSGVPREHDDRERLGAVGTISRAAGDLAGGKADDSRRPGIGAVWASRA